MSTLSYESELSWTGKPAGGRPSDHTLIFPPHTALMASADKAFNGDPNKPNPEQLLVAAASSCQFLSFAYVTNRADLTMLTYQDTASAVLDLEIRPARFVSIHLRPRVSFAQSISLEKLQAMCERAHHLCYVGNTLNCPVRVEPELLQATA